MCCFKWKKSSWQDVKSGIPQGSILGPFLFLTYVNDLPRSISSLFADDTKIMQSISTLANHVQLQTDLDSLAKCSDMWQLNFNAKRSILVKPHTVIGTTLPKWGLIGLS